MVKIRTKAGIVKKHKHGGRKKPQKNLADQVKFAEIPTEIAAIREQLNEYFSNNPQENYLDTGKVIAGKKLLYSIFKFPNGVVVAELKVIGTTGKSTVISAVDINHKQGIPVGMGAEYALKLDDSKDIEGANIEMQRLRENYETSPVLQNMMHVITVNKDNKQQAIAVMPRFLGDNLQSMLDSANALTLTKKTKITKKKIKTKTAAKVKPEVKIETKTKVKPEAKVNIEQKTKADIETKIETKTNKIKKLTRKQSIKTDRPRAVSWWDDVGYNEGLPEEASEKLEKAFKIESDDVFTPKQSTASSTTTTAVADKAQSDIEKISNELNNLDLLDNQEFETFKNVLQQGVASGVFKNDFINLLTEDNLLPKPQAPRPLKWEPNLTKPIRDEVAIIPDRKVFLEKFIGLLESSIQYVDYNMNMSKKNFVLRDLKPDNLNKHGVDIWPFDMGEVIPLPLKSATAFMHEVMPHGTQGFLSPYNAAVLKYLEQYSNRIEKARKTLAYYAVLSRLNPELRKEITDASLNAFKDDLLLKIINRGVNLLNYNLKIKFTEDNLNVLKDKLSEKFTDEFLERSNPELIKKITNEVLTGLRDVLAEEFTDDILNDLKSGLSQELKASEKILNNLKEIVFRKKDVDVLGLKVKSHLMKELENAATIPPYVFNAKSDANSTAVVLEMMSRLEVPIAKYDANKGGLPQSVAASSVEDEPFVALYNNFLLITKNLANPDIAHNYVDKNAEQDLESLLSKATALEEHHDTYVSVSPIVTMAKQIQPNMLGGFSRAVNSSKAEREFLHAIDNAFDVLASFPKETSHDIANVPLLRAGTLITIGYKIHKLKNNIYKLPNGALVADSTEDFDHGSYSVEREWTDLRTGKQLIAKVLNNYNNKNTQEEKLKIENDAISEASIMNKFYKTYLNGKFKDPEAQVIKIQGKNSPNLVILQQKFFKKGIAIKPPQSILSMVESAITVVSEAGKQPTNTDQKSVVKKPVSKPIEADEIFVPTVAEEYAENSSFMKYYQAPPQTQTLETESKVINNGSAVNPESVVTIMTPEQIEQEAVREARGHKFSRVAALFGALPTMEFYGDSVPLKIDDYLIKYSKSMFDNSRLYNELQTILVGFIPAKFNDKTEDLEPNTEENKLIEKPVPNDTTEKLVDFITSSKNECLAIQHGHNLNIIFTDINDDNLLEGNNNAIFPIDFGATKTVEEQSGFSNDELELRGTFEFATPENRRVLIHNVENYPQAIQARKALAILQVLKNKQANGEQVHIPDRFTSNFINQLEETAYIPQNKYTQQSALYALGCTLERNCTKKIELIANDYHKQGIGLPKHYQSPTNDPAIAILNQVLKISKKLKDLNSNYSAGDAAKDFDKLQQRIQKSYLVAQKLKNPATIIDRMREVVLRPKSSAKAKALYDPNREVWNNTAQSFALALDPDRFDVLPQRDHSINIHDKKQNKTAAIMKRIDDPEDPTQQLVEGRLLLDSNDKSSDELIEAELCAFLATTKKGTPITLEDHSENPELAVQIENVAARMNAADKNLKLKILFSNKDFDSNNISTAMAVAKYKQNPQNKTPMPPAPSLGGIG